MYINTTTKDQASLSQIRRANPNISLPRQPDETTLNALGFVTVQPTERPDGDVVTQGTPEQREDSKWYQTWEVREFTAEELEQQRKARIPNSITPRQTRLALLEQGLLDQVSTALDSLPAEEKEAAKIEWEYATTIERNSQWVANLGQALGLTEVQIDDLFITASNL